MHCSRVLRSVLVVIMSALLLGGCGRNESVDPLSETTPAKESAAGAIQQQGCADRDIVAELEKDDPYELVLATFAGRGTEAAESAWADRRPTLLLFASGW